MKIIAVIVTYNRLPLLKKCLDAVNRQSRKPDEVIIIDNGSTDDTEAWLCTQEAITYKQKNLGGAGGFSAGVNIAYQRDADWIWLMDDDTIPENDALEQLEHSLKDLRQDVENVGFLSSLVYWTDGNIHEMNKTYELKDQKKLDKLRMSGKRESPIIQFGTFVSMLLSAKAVKEVGLPVKEFFIWTDDVEYSKRILNSGLAGLLIVNSKAIHETPVNHLSSVFKDIPGHLWKYRYGLRNEMFTKRLYEGEVQFWITWLHRMFLLPVRIVLNRKNARWPFIKVIWKSSIEALFFHPKIEKAHPVKINRYHEIENNSIEKDRKL